jgi:plasmid stabilization system protein ParE
MTEPRWTAGEALKVYKSWADKAHDIADNPKLGYDTESYRAAIEMSARWLGRYDVLSAWEYRTERDAEAAGELE